MEWLINNWTVVIGIVAVLGVAGLAVYKFAGLPNAEQVKKIKKWLLFAVLSAEKELGGHTGEMKLLTVYNLFISKFPMAAKLVSFEVFKVWVDEALVEMEKLLKENVNIKTIVEGK